MADYTQIKAQLQRVRTSWKRTAALTGLAVAGLELVGLLGLAMFVDWLYRFGPAGRTVLAGVVVVAALVLVARHVLVPLLKRIPDERIALYVEEHNDRFEGSLLTAVELEAHPDEADEAMTRAVVDSAMRRAQAMGRQPVVRPVRLVKYAALAGLAMVAWIVMVVSFPSSVGHHTARVLAPWRPTREDVAAAERNRPAPPIEIALSAGDTKLLRGATLKLEATCSRWPGHRVLLHFRAAGAGEQTPWRHIEMREIDKLHTYAASLQDVNEEMNFYVSAGPDRSSVHRIAVYDPLVIDGIEIVTRYPEYMKLPAARRIEAIGNVAAPVGSTLELRVLTNRPLIGGELTVRPEDGPVRTVALTPDPDRSTTATAELAVTVDAIYAADVRDDQGQAARTADAYVQALADRPPAMELTWPMEEITIHPLGEVIFAGTFADDYGLDRAEVVCRRVRADGETRARYPLTLRRRDADANRPFPDAAAGRFRLAMEDLDPPVRPEEVFLCHVEAFDRKGQVVASGMRMITVAHYETWQTFLSHPPLEMDMEVEHSIWAVLRQAWEVHRQRGDLPPKQLAAQCLSIADGMIDPETGQFVAYYKLEDIPEDKHRFCRAADKHIADAHAALEAAETARAVESLQQAVAQLTLAGLTDTEMLLQTELTGLTAPEDEQDAASLAQLLTEMEMEVSMEQPPETEEEMENRKEQAEQAAQAAEKARELAAKQEEIARKAEQAAREPEPHSRQQRREDEQLAEQEKRVADETRRTADELDKTRPESARLKEQTRDLQEAAEAMKQAAEKMKTGEMSDAAKLARQAQHRLQKAAGDLDQLHREKLAKALAEAEKRMARLSTEQKRIRRQTRDLAEKKPDPDDADVRRELKKIAAKQVKVKVELARAARAVGELKKLAADAAKPETQKEIEDAENTLRRARPERRVDAAIVELTDKKPRRAEEHQKAAEEAMDKTLASLERASDSLAADREAELRRALNEAREIEQSVEKLQRKAEPDESSERRPEPLAPDRQRELVDQTAHTLKRFTRHVEARDFGDRADREQLKRHDDDAARREALRDEKKRKELGRLVARMRDRLEAEYQATLRAKKLYAAQRQQCPPKYRHVVNKYYEKLSEMDR